LGLLLLLLIGWSGAQRGAGVAEKRWSGADRGAGGRGARSGGYRNRLEREAVFFRRSRSTQSSICTPIAEISAVERKSGQVT